MFSPLPVYLQAVVAVSLDDLQGFTPPLIRFDIPATISPFWGQGRREEISPLLHNSYLEHCTCFQTKDASRPQVGGEFL